MKQNELIGYGLAAIVVVMVLHYCGQWIIGGLALVGGVHLFNVLGRKRRG